MSNNSHQEINTLALISEVTAFNQTSFAADRVSKIIQQTEEIVVLAGV
jgi:hypothetical protein